MAQKFRNRIRRLAWRGRDRDDDAQRSDAQPSRTSTHLEVNPQPSPPEPAPSLAETPTCPPALSDSQPASTDPSAVVSPPAQPDIAGLSLWNRAYEGLREKNSQLVEKYEKLLSTELPGYGTPKSPSTSNGEADSLDNVENRLKTGSDRRSQLQQITDKGLQRMDQKRTKYTLFGHEFVLWDQIAETAKLAQALKGLVDEAVKVSSEASLAWAGVCVLLPVLTNPVAVDEANRDGLTYVTSRLRYYVEFESLLWPNNLEKPDLKEQLENHVADLYQHILEFQIKSVLRFYRTWVAKLGREVVLYDDWKESLSKVKELENDVRNEYGDVSTAASRESLEALKTAAERQLAVMTSLLSVAQEHLVVAEKHRDISSEQQMDVKDIKRIISERADALDLPVVYEARYDSADVRSGPKCEEHTRVRIRDEIVRWVDADTAEPLFWLVGPAGTGKSTIARTVADFLDSNGQLAAGYFFKRGEQGRNGTARVFPTIASQLVEAIPSFKHCLAKSLGNLEKEAVEKRALESQFTLLLFKPLADLRSVEPAGVTWVIIVDALDECEGESDLSLLLSVLCRLEDVTSVRLRVLITSRSDPGIVDAFEPISSSCRKLDLHRDCREDAKTDIATFLNTEFASIKKKSRITQDPWPKPEILDRLVRLATEPDALFIYAATLCRFVYDKDCPNPRSVEPPKARLKKWLKQCNENRSQLNQIYEPILNQILPDRRKPEYHARLRFLGAVALLAAPLPTTSLASLLQMDIDDVAWWLPHLHAVLDIPADPRAPVRLLHKSFSDFLLAEAEGDSGSARLRVDTKEIHAFLASSCVRLMTSKLRKDICDIRDLDTSRDSIDKKTLDEHIPPELQYASLYWIQHLQRSELPVTDGNDIYEFFHAHFLHWLEILSLMDKLADGVFAIRKLLKILDVSIGTTTRFARFAKDADRFLSSFGSIIQQYPLQIYSTALIFSPTSSEVKQVYWKERLPLLRVIHGIKRSWSSTLQTLEGHSRPVNNVAFSPDGKVVASASEDNTVRLWDAATGTHMRTLDGHDYWVRAVAFSPDGKVIASASYDKTVRLWDTATGTHMRTLDGHGERVTAVAFSPDSQVIASASHDNTVRLWDAATGTYTRTLDGHYRCVTAVAFSPDGKVVASASYDKTVRLWDATTGTHMRTLDGHGRSVTAVAFSPDGKVVASASDDETVRLWDTATGTHMRTLDGHGHWVTAVAFSPDGKIILSASYNGTIRLWDVATGVYTRTLDGDSGPVTAVAFSPDGKVIASASDDNAVRLWDAGTGTHTQTYRGYGGSFTAVAFSPDGKVIASASNAGSVWLCDTATGAYMRTLDGHGERVTAVAFSPDGKDIASASYDDTVRLWDAATGTPAQTIKIGRIMRVMFDPMSNFRLSTDKGILSVPTRSNASSTVTEATKAISQEPDFCGWGISADGMWIMNGSKNVLWLPPDYRPSVSAVRGSTVVIGCSSGRVVIILFVVPKADITSVPGFI